MLTVDITYKDHVSETESGWIITCVDDVYEANDCLVVEHYDEEDGWNKTLYIPLANVLCWEVLEEE